MVRRPAGEKGTGIAEEEEIEETVIQLQFNFLKL